MSVPARILLVDDAEGVRLTLAALLEDAGHQVVEAASLASAREQARGGGFDLAVVDLNLPDGRGTELIAELEREHPRTVAVLLSGDGGAGAAGAALSLAKSGEPGELLAQLEQVLERARR